MRKHKQLHYIKNDNAVHEYVAYDMKEVISQLPVNARGFGQTMETIASGATLADGVYWGQGAYSCDYYRMVFTSNGTRCGIEEVHPPMVYWKSSPI